MPDSSSRPEPNATRLAAVPIDLDLAHQARAFLLLALAIWQLWRVVG